MMWKLLTLKRLAALWGCIVSELVSRLIGRPIIWGFPSVISIEPTAYCNLHCPECPSGNGDLLRNRGYMDIALFEKLLNEIASRSLAIQFFFQGEPFLNSNLTEMIRQASAAHLYTQVSTNGHFLEENATQLCQSGLNKLIISLDGITPETYTRYRQGGNFDKVKQGIIHLLEEKKKQKTRLPQIELQFIVFEHNEHEIATFKHWCKQLNVKSVLKTAQLNKPGKGQVNPPKKSQLSRYTQHEVNHWSKKSITRNACRRLWLNPVICWDGTIAVCCYDKDALFNIGNINQTSLTNMWKNKAFQTLRNNILKGNSMPKMCANCGDH